MSKQAESWWVYIVQTQKNKLYTGITTDLKRRFEEHCAVAQGRGGRGAKFFRQDAPLNIVFCEAHSDRASASRREYQIKQMSRSMKDRLLSEAPQKA